MMPAASDNPSACLTSCYSVALYRNWRCDCAERSFFNSMPFRCPYFSTPVTPSLLPLLCPFKLMSREAMQKLWQKITEHPPRPSCTCMCSVNYSNTLNLMTVRVTSIQIQLSSGWEINWLLKQTPGLRVTSDSFLDNQTTKKCSK